ncbi:hypothetical protein D9M70_607470 [compost metagenome]
MMTRFTTTITASVTMAAYTPVMRPPKMNQPISPANRAGTTKPAKIAIVSE